MLVHSRFYHISQDGAFGPSTETIFSRSEPHVKASNGNN